MGSNSKENRKIAERKLQNYIDYYINYFSELFNNSVTVENPPLIPEDYKSNKNIEIPKRYLLGVLRSFGGIAYDKITGMYLRYTKRMLDVYGLPKSYQLYGYNGYIAERNPEDVVILRANDLEYAIDEYINIQARKLAEIDNAIQQNLDACKTMTIVVADSEQQVNTLVNMQESRRLGSSAMYVAKNVMTGQNPMTSLSTGATYLCDKMQELRTQVLRETLSNLGFSVSNEDKKERVQAKELDTLNTHGLDAINVLVDTFNYDAEYGGLSIRLKANTEIALQRDEQDDLDFNKEGDNQE